MRHALFLVALLFITAGSATAQEKSAEQLRKERAAAIERFEKAAAEVDRLRKLDSQYSAARAETKDTGPDSDSSAMDKFEQFIKEELARREKEEAAEKPASPPSSDPFANPFASPTDAGVARSVSIGTQVWTTENLSTTHFRNGDPIPEARTTEEWLAAHSMGKPAWCYLRNDPDNGKAFGRLYNWYAVTDPRGLAPAGWHIPTEAEWETLSRYVGQSMEGGGKLRSSTGWKTGGGDDKNTNESGFDARPGSCRGIEGAFYTEEPGIHGFWWSSTAFDPLPTGYGFNLDWYGALGKNIYLKYGLSVRCVKD